MSEQNFELNNDDKEISYENLFKELIEGFALHEIICDENCKPVNYRFLDVNPAFERMVGIKKEDILGKLVLDVMPDTESFWIDTYGNVALTGDSIIFEHFSKHLNKFYQVTSFSPKKGQFVSLFEDITSRKEAEEKLESFERLLTFSKEELQSIDSQIITARQQLANSRYRFCIAEKEKLEAELNSNQALNKLMVAAYAANASNNLRFTSNWKMFIGELISEPTASELAAAKSDFLKKYNLTD